MPAVQGVALGVQGAEVAVQGVAAQGVAAQVAGSWAAELADARHPAESPRTDFAAQGVAMRARAV